MKVVQCKLIKKVDKASVWIRLDFIRQVKNLFGYDPVQGRKETKARLGLLSAQVRRGLLAAQA